MYEHYISYLRFVFRRRLSLFAVGCSVVVVVDVPDLLCVYRLFKKSSKSTYVGLESICCRFLLPLLGD
ncbi:GSCOCG00004872001-RA-CDS [Cotesia congregata]|nr:GSCOCG00004872001-RA-CDS [Cotesia congregata]